MLFGLFINPFILYFSLYHDEGSLCYILIYILWLYLQSVMYFSLEFLDHFIWPKCTGRLGQIWRLIFLLQFCICLCTLTKRQTCIVQKECLQLGLALWNRREQMWERNLKYSNRWKSLIWSFSEEVVLNQLELRVNEQKPIKSQTTRIASALPPP